jgi:hypothetical protein
MALATGDVTYVDPPPPPIPGDITVSPETTTSYRNPDISAPDVGQPSVVATLAPVPNIPGGSYGGPSLDTPRLFDTATDKDYDAAVQAETGYLEKKIGTDALAAKNYRDREDRYRARQEQAAEALAFGVGDLKPWNTQEAIAATKHNLWEEFGSPGFIFSMLASSFTAFPMVSALNGGAAAMNAINQGDMDAYNTAFDAWKANSELVIKRERMEQDYFSDIENLRKDNFEDWRNETAIGLAKFNDQRSLMLLHMGMFKELDEAREGKAKAVLEMEKSKQAIEENEVQRQIVMRAITDDQGKIRPEYQQHPEHIAEVMSFAKRAMTTPTNAEEAALNSALMTPDFPLKSNEEKSKIIADALRPIYEAKAAGRAFGLSQADAAWTDRRAKELQEIAASKGEQLSEPQAYSIARGELENQKASAKGDPLKRQQATAVLERTEQIEADAANKGETIDHASALARAIAEFKQKAKGGLELTPEGDTKPPPGTAQTTWDFDADTFRQTGVMPSLGLGGAEYKAGLRNHAAFREIAAGGSEGTMQARWAISKGLGKALSGFYVQEAAVEAFSRNAELNSAVLVQLAGKVDKTGRPAIERWRRWVKGQYGGDDDVKAFQAQVVTWRNEIAKIVTNPNLNGQLTVHAMEESKAYAGEEWGLDQIKKTVSLFRGDAERRKQSIAEEKQKLSYQIAHLINEMPGKEEIPAATAPTWLSPEDQKAAIWLATNPNDKNAEAVRQRLKKALEGVP